MREATDWNYDAFRQTYHRTVGICSINVWQTPDGQWMGTIESGRRRAIRGGFLSFSEAQAWIEQEVGELIAIDRRQTRRAS